MTLPHVCMYIFAYSVIITQIIIQQPIYVQKLLSFYKKYSCVK